MRRRRLLVFLLAPVLLTACGPHEDMKLDLRAVSITVPRLVTPAVQLVPPAVTPQPVGLPPVPPLVTFLPPVVQAPQALPVPAAPACPKAGQFEVPAVPASQILDKPPAPATFTQQASFHISAGGKRASLAGLQKVVISALPKAVTSVGQQVDGYRVVRTVPGSKTSSVEVYQLVHASSAPTATPSGIYLVGLAWTDPVLGDLTFHPSGNGLQILPNPVAQAQSGVVQYAGSATDPDTLTTLTLSRNVTGRKRVDACGQLIDTFTVEMSGTLVTRDSQWQVGWTQQLATAYGGVDVEDTLTLSTPVDNFNWSRVARNTALPKETT